MGELLLLPSTYFERGIKVSALTSQAFMKIHPKATMEWSLVAEITLRHIKYCKTCMR